MPIIKCKKCGHPHIYKDTMPEYCTHCKAPLQEPVPSNVSNQSHQSMESDNRQLEECVQRHQEYVFRGIPTLRCEQKYVCIKCTKIQPYSLRESLNIETEEEIEIHILQCGSLVMMGERLLMPDCSLQFGNKTLDVLDWEKINKGKLRYSVRKINMSAPSVDKEWHDFPMEEGEFIIGRNDEYYQEADINIQDDYRVHHYHALITAHKAGDLYQLSSKLEPLGNFFQYSIEYTEYVKGKYRYNRIKINGQELGRNETRPINVGDVITLGNTQIEFMYE